MLNNYYQKLKGNITVPFGGKTNGESFHGGIDIANSKGTPIPAMSGGVVTNVVNGFQSQDGKGYGNRVQIKDAQGNIHQYSHLQQPLVTPGQKVGVGQEVGKMGDSGNSYTPQGTGDASHLDYRIKSPQGQMLNPTPVVSSALGEETSRGQGGPGFSNLKSGVKINSLSNRIAKAHKKFNKK